jgi:hypothetical protein
MWIMTPAIRHSSVEGGATTDASASLATLCNGTLRDAPVRRISIKRGNRAARNHNLSDCRYISVTRPASGVLAHPLAASIRPVPVGAGRVDHFSNSLFAAVFSAFQRGSL